VRITTDQGRQFESKLFAKLGIHTGFQHSRTTAYNAKCDGKIERFFRHLKSALMCHNGSTWYDALPVVLLGIRSAFKEDLQATTAELVYGEPLRLPGQLIQGPPLDGELDPTQFVDRLRHTMAQIRPTAAARHAQPRVFVYKELGSCSHVLLRDDAVSPPLVPPYLGPYKVAKRDAKTFVILIGDKQVRVSIDRLKPAFILDDGTTDRSGTPSDRQRQSARTPDVVTTPSEAGADDLATHPSETNADDVVTAPPPGTADAPPPHPEMAASDQPTPSPGRSTRSGRRVHFPDRLEVYHLPPMSRRRVTFSL